MNMFSQQIDGLRNAAEMLNEIGISIGYNDTASTFIVHDITERMKEAAYIIEYLQKQLTRYNIAESGEEK